MRERARRIETEALYIYQQTYSRELEIDVVNVQTAAARRALNPDPDWWCPACRAGRTGEACTTCGLLRELAPQDCGIQPPEPSIEDVEVRGRILSEVGPPQRLPGWEWPWMTYLALAAAVMFIVRSGLLNAVAGWLAPILGVALLVFLALVLFRRQALRSFWARYLALVLFRRQALRSFWARYLSQLVRRERLRYVLSVELVDDPRIIEVTIDAPRPWPPLGPDLRQVDNQPDHGSARQGDADVSVTFFGGWHSSEQFIADRIVPPLVTGRPMVIASGHAQPLLWLGAILGAIAITQALTY